jgi:hypothetical protein
MVTSPAAREREDVRPRGLYLSRTAGEVGGGAAG